MGGKVAVSLSTHMWGHLYTYVYSYLLLSSLLLLSSWCKEVLLLGLVPDGGRFAKANE